MFNFEDYEISAEQMKEAGLDPDDFTSTEVVTFKNPAGVIGVVDDHAVLEDSAENFYIVNDSVKDYEYAVDEGIYETVDNELMVTPISEVQDEEFKKHLYEFAAEVKEYDRKAEEREKENGV